MPDHDPTAEWRPCKPGFTAIVSDFPAHPGQQPMTKEAQADYGGKYMVAEFNSREIMRLVLRLYEMGYKTGMEDVIEDRDYAEERD